MTAHASTLSNTVPLTLRFALFLGAAFLFTLASTPMTLAQVPPITCAPCPNVPISPQPLVDLMVVDPFAVLAYNETSTSAPPDVTIPLCPSELLSSVDVDIIVQNIPLSLDAANATLQTVGGSDLARLATEREYPDAEAPFLPLKFDDAPIEPTGAYVLEFEDDGGSVLQQDAFNIMLGGPTSLPLHSVCEGNPQPTSGPCTVSSTRWEWPSPVEWENSNHGNELSVDELPIGTNSWTGKHPYWWSCQPEKSRREPVLEAGFGAAAKTRITGTGSSNVWFGIRYDGKENWKCYNADGQGCRYYGYEMLVSNARIVMQRPRIASDYLGHGAANRLHHDCPTYVDQLARIAIDEIPLQGIVTQFIPDHGCSHVFTDQSRQTYVDSEQHRVYPEKGAIGGGVRMNPVSSGKMRDGVGYLIWNYYEPGDFWMSFETSVENQFAANACPHDCATLKQAWMWHWGFHHQARVVQEEQN